MNQFNVKQDSSLLTTFRQTLRRALGGLNRDQSGTALTEFVIVLPVFLMIFSGVMILGEFSRKGTEAPVKAYKKTFKKALAYQNDFGHLGANVDGLGGSATSIDQLGVGIGEDVSPAHNKSGIIETTTQAAELLAYGGLGLDGTMGESYLRTKPLGMVSGMDLIAADAIGSSWCTNCKVLNEGNPDLLTRKLRDRTGESRYAYALLNDSKTASAFQKGTSVYQKLNDAVTAGGIRPAAAAGIRYGTVSGQAQDTMSIAGRNMDFNAHFSTLVPPGTQGGGQGPRVDALRATAVSRLTMLGHNHYKGLLGIQSSQKLSGSANFDVPDYAK